MNGLFMCGAQGMAQLVLAMQDPSLDPQHPYKKSGMVAHACNPSASKIPGAQQPPASFAELVNSRFSGKEKWRLFWPLHALAHTHSDHMYICIYKGTYI